jgi:hypothetical protein
MFMRNLFEQCDVRFWVKSDISQRARHVRFTLKSGHVRCDGPCPLWANSGHGVGLDQHSDTREDNPDFGELARLRLDLD